MSDKLDKLIKLKQLRTKPLQLEGVNKVLIKGDPGKDVDPLVVANKIKQDRAFVDSLQGQDYVLTAQDKKDIAASIKVPIVKEKTVVKRPQIIETTTKVVEKPINTVVREEYTPDFDDLAITTINTLEMFEGDDRLDISAIKGWEDKIKKATSSLPQGGSHGLNRVYENGTAVLKGTGGINFGSGINVIKSQYGVDITVDGSEVAEFQTLQDVTDLGATTTNNITIDNGGLTNNNLNLNGSTHSTIRSTATDELQIIHGGSIIGEFSTSKFSVNGQIYAESANFPVLGFNRLTTLGGTGSSLDSLDGVASSMELKTTTTASAVEGFGGGIVFRTEDVSGTGNILSRLYVRRGSNDNSGHMQIWTGSTGQDHVFHFDEDGSLGLGGITNPTEALDVGGKIAIDGEQFIYVPGGDFIGSSFIGGGGTNLTYVSSTNGRYNTFSGINTGADITTGSYNAGFGYNALHSLVGGQYNMAIGVNACYNLTNAGSVVGIGYNALYNNTASYNVAIGSSVLKQNTIGAGNVGIGYAVMGVLTGNSTYNVGIGYGVGNTLTSGTENLMLGKFAVRDTIGGSPITQVSRGTYLGVNVHPSAVSGNVNEIVIGYNAEGQGDDTVVIGNDDITDTFLKGDVTTNGDMSSAGVQKQVNTLGDITGATAIDLSDGTYITGTLTGAITLSFDSAGYPESGYIKEFTLAFTDVETITYPAGTKFSGGVAPTIIGDDYELSCAIDSSGIVTVYGVIDDIS